MKLSEAISIRENLIEKLKQLEARLKNNVRVPKGNIPTENPGHLLREIDSTLRQLRMLSCQILNTESQTYCQQKPLTLMLAETRVLEWRIQIMKEAVTVATSLQTEDGLHYESAVDVNLLNRQIDTLEELHREESSNIQALLLITELENIPL